MAKRKKVTLSPDESPNNIGVPYRAHEAPKFHLLPSAGMARIAARFSLGFDKYGDNWKDALRSRDVARQFCIETYDHAFEHMTAMADGTDVNDDHLGAIGWAVFVLAQVEKEFGIRWPDL